MLLSLSSPLVPYVSTMMRPIGVASANGISSLSCVVTVVALVTVVVSDIILLWLVTLPPRQCDYIYMKILNGIISIIMPILIAFYRLIVHPRVRTNTFFRWLHPSESSIPLVSELGVYTTVVYCTHSCRTVDYTTTSLLYCGGTVRTYVCSTIIIALPPEFCLIFLNSFGTQTVTSCFVCSRPDPWDAHCLAAAAFSTVYSIVLL